MTDDQAMVRWKFRYDFIEAIVVELLVKHTGMKREHALDYIRLKCESEMRKKGFKYPFTEEDP